MTTVWDRAGNAFSQGAPAGASLTIGQATTDSEQAGAAGRMFGQAQQGASFFKPAASPFAPQPTLQERMAQAKAHPVAQQDAPSILGQIGNATGDLLGMTLHALNVPLQAHSRFWQASIRQSAATADEARETGDWGKFLRSALEMGGLARILDPEFRAQYENASDSRASLAQTAERAVSGQGFDLLDNPYRATERAEYYSTGMMRWTTGVADAAFDLFADPLLVAGKAAKIVKGAREVLGAEDVVKIADRTIDAAELSAKQQRGRDVIDALVEATEPGKLTDGTVSALARTKFFSQSTDSGALAYMMGRANALPEFAGDAVARQAFKRDIIAAGMGDQAALTRLGERSRVLQAEVQAMSDDVLEARWADRLAEPNANMSSIFEEMHTEPGWVRGMEVQRADIEKEFEAIARIRRIGSPADTGIQGVGELGRVTATFRDAGKVTSRDVLRQYGWVQKGRFLPPVHIMDGIHVPATMRLSRADAPEVFDAALQRARGVVPDAQLAQFRDRFYSAIGYGTMTKVDRAAVVREFHEAVEAGLAAKHGKNLEEIQVFMRDMRMRRSEELKSLYSRAYKSDPGEVVLHRTDDTTFAYGPEAAEEFRASGGVLDLDKPVLPSQLQDWVSILDTKLIDRYIGRQTAGGWEGHFVRGADGALHVGNLMLTAFNHLWKFSALFRLAYPARVQIDSQARLLASLGPMKYALMAAKGARNTLYNDFKRVDTAVMADYTRRYALAERLDDVERELASWGSPSVPREKLLSEQDKLRQMLDKPSKIKLSGNKVRVKGTEMQRLLGKRELNAKKTGLTGDKGSSAYGNIGEFRAVSGMMNAQDNIIGMMFEGESSKLRQLRGTGNWDLIAGDNPQWADSYLRAVNQQIRNDAVGRMVMARKSDAEILNWLDRTPEGRSYWRAMGAQWGREGKEVWLAQARQHIDTLVPDDAARALVSRTALSRKDVQEMWPLAGQRPAVQGEILKPQLAATSSFGELYEHTQTWWFKIANDIPEQMMARHPYYVASFSGHMKELVRNTGRTQDALSLRQINELRRQASLLARKDVGKVMFDTSKATNLGYHMRFLSPFYAAWYDTMTKWGRIMGNNLNVPLQGRKVFAAPNAAGLVVDKDGRQIDAEGNVLDIRFDDDGKAHGTGEVVGKANIFNDGTIALPMPSWFEERTGQSKLMIGKNSLNVIFQGDPFWAPPVGPLLEVPINQLLIKAFPEIAPAMADTAIGRYLTSGFGLTDESPLDQVLPTWVKNLMLATSGDSSDPRFSQAYILEYQSLLAEIDNGERGPMSLDELQDVAASRTRNKFIMQFFGSWGVPVSTRTQGRMQYYLDTYREYQRQYGLDAYTKFSDDFPEYTELAISLSANETGVDASLGAWETVQPYRKAMARDPEFGWAFAGAENLLGEFDSNVYTLERGTAIGPGTTKTFRSSRDPMESIRQNAVAKGWNDYWKASSAIDDALEKAGLTSINQKGAQKFKAAKDSYIAALAAQNPTWGDAYNSSANGNTAVRFLSWASEQVTEYPQLGERSDFQTLFKYVEGRAAMQQALSKLFGDDAGLPQKHSIYSEKAKNAGLTQAWEKYTQGLAQSDLGFNQMWTRARLETDDLTGSVY